MTDKKVVHHDFCGMVTDRRNRKIANQGKEEVIITVTVARPPKSLCKIE